MLYITIQPRCANPGEISDKHWNKIKNTYKEKETEENLETVLFVPITRHSELIKKQRKADEEIRKVTTKEKYRQNNISTIKKHSKIIKTA